MAQSPLRTLTPTERHEIHQAFARLNLAFVPQWSGVEPFRVSDIKGKGRGCTAVRNIPRGTMILMEEPTFTVKIFEGDRKTRSATAQIEYAVRTLKQHVIEEFRSLTHPPGEKTDRGRFEVNNFEMMGYRGGGSQQGVFLRAARFNHSCVPNACFYWNPNLGKHPQGRLTIFATQDIRRYEEICLDYQYTECYKTAIERRRSLYNTHNFVCNCRACDQTAFEGELSEWRRSQMRGLVGRSHNEIGDLNKRRYQQGQDISQLILLLDQEGMEFPQKSQLLDDLARWFLRESQSAPAAWPRANCLKEGLRASRRKLDLEILTIGAESVEVRNALDLIALFKRPGRMPMD
ncbi:MAG: hypothetical protein Q9178_004629 [Gyalolechia marmorata]